MQGYFGPEALEDCTVCHRGNALTTRKDLAHFGLIAARHSWYVDMQAPAVKQGEDLVKAYACRRCHVIGERGNPLATSLDAVAAKRSSHELEQAILHPALFMPLFPVAHISLELLLNRVLAGGYFSSKESDNQPLVVYFSHEAQEEDAFTRYCGSCHRLLSNARGGLGSARIGPNLSGMGTDFFPHSAKDNKAWTRKMLQDWIENPRKIRPLATMPPLRLKEGELNQVLDIVWSEHNKEE